MAERKRSTATAAPDLLTFGYGGEDGNAPWRLTFMGEGVTSAQVGCKICAVVARCTEPNMSEDGATFAILAGNRADVNARHCK